MFYGSFGGSEVDDGYCPLVSRDEEGANQEIKVYLMLKVNS